MKIFFQPVDINSERSIDRPPFDEYKHESTTHLVFLYPGRLCELYASRLAHHATMRLEEMKAQLDFLKT